MESGIYKITNTVNGTIYIGKSIDLSQRWFSHRSYLRKGTHCNQYLQRAWNKYGESAFIFEIIEYCNILDIDQREIFMIAEYDTFNNGYNLTLGGEGCAGRIPTEKQREVFRIYNATAEPRKGWNHSDEAKAKISKAHKGRKITNEQKESVRKAHLGKKLTEEHKEKIRQCVIGRKHSEEAKVKVSEAHRGELNGTAKLTDKQVVQIKNLLKSGTMLSKDIAKMFNVSVQTICFINKGKTWKHIAV